MNPRLAPLNALRAFEAAARLLSFKNAAEELHVTPTAISHQIRTLEHFLGVRLFRRLPRALELTPAGEALMPGIRDGLERFAHALELARSSTRHARLTVLCPPLFAVRWLLPRLSAFSSQHPEITLRVARSVGTIEGMEDQAPRAGQRPEDGLQAKILFAQGPQPGTRAERLFAPTLVPVCAPALAHGPHPLKTPADLRHHTLLHDESIPGAGDWPSWEEWLEAAGVSGVDARQGLRYSDSSLAIEAALAGLGVGLALSSLVGDEVAAGRLVRPFTKVLPARLSYFLVLPPQAAAHPAVEAFRDWILEQARGMTP